MFFGMPRPLRIEYPGAIYHVINRGNQRQNIFRDDADRLGFVSTLGEACQKTGWQVRCLVSAKFRRAPLARRKTADFQPQNTPTFWNQS